MHRWILTLALMMGTFLVAEETDYVLDNTDEMELLAEEDSSTPKPDISKISEAFGYFLGKSLTNESSPVSLDIEKMIQGLRLSQTDSPPPMTEEEYQAAFLQLQQYARDETADTNLDEANAFMKKNRKDNNIEIIVADKLHYEVLKEGDGEVVTEQSTPLIHYSGKFLNGKSFGSSEQTGPLSLTLSTTIPGFRQGIAGMEEGEKRRLYIHPELGYGDQGPLPPNSLLIIDVEVLKANATAEAEESEKE